MRFWLGSALFRTYLRSFVVLWVVGKIANAATAAYVGLAPFAFRPASELVACTAALLVLSAFIRRAHTDILLGNVGVSFAAAFAPLVLAHCFLSAVLALLT